MSELFSAYFFNITIIGMGVLTLPLFYKLWKRIKHGKRRLSLLRSSLSDFSFVLVWLIVGIGASMWISFFASSRDATIQTNVAQVVQFAWVIAGLILSISNRAVIGALLGTIMSLLISIGAGGVLGFIIGALGGIWFDTSHLIEDKLFNALSVGVVMAIIFAFCAAIFFSTFITFGGAMIGFLADIFGKAYLYEKLLQRFRVSPNHSE